MSMVNHTTSSPEKPKGKITFLFSFFFFLLIWVLFSLVVFIRHLFDVLIRSTRSRMEIFFAVYFDEFSLKWRWRRGNCLISWLKWIFQFQFELKTPISYQKGGMEWSCANWKIVLKSTAKIQSEPKTIAVQCVQVRFILIVFFVLESWVDDISMSLILLT